MNTMKRFVAICLCLCLLIPIAGCGGKKEGGDGAGGETAGDGFVYTAEFKGLAGNSLEKADVQGNRMYYADWDYDEESQTSTGSIKYLDLDTLANETFPFALAEGESVACLQALEDKSLLLLLAVWNENDMNQTYFLVKTDGSGTETMRLDATGFLTEGSAQDLNYGYPQAMQTDAEGNIYILVSGMEGFSCCPMTAARKTGAVCCSILIRRRKATARASEGSPWETEACCARLRERKRSLFPRGTACTATIWREKPASRF